MMPSLPPPLPPPLPPVAYDILSDPKCRRAYDSADPTFSDDVPTVCELSKEHFFDVFGPVFEDNVRYVGSPFHDLGGPHSLLCGVPIPFYVGSPFHGMWGPHSMVYVFPFHGVSIMTCK